MSWVNERFTRKELDYLLGCEDMINDFMGEVKKMDPDAKRSYFVLIIPDTPNLRQVKVIIGMPVVYHAALEEGNAMIVGRRTWEHIQGCKTCEEKLLGPFEDEDEIIPCDICGHPIHDSILDMDDNNHHKLFYDCPFCKQRTYLEE